MKTIVPRGTSFCCPLTEVRRRWQRLNSGRSIVANDRNRLLTLPLGARFSLITMKIGELARQAGVSTKAVRYYESVGLLHAERLPNGYRDYGIQDVRMVREIRELAAAGIRVEQAKPFLDCLVAGNSHGDDCPDAMTAYRKAITELDGGIADLEGRRAALSDLLRDANLRAEPTCDLVN
jgi:DNA-binding transcriptional MerR regulator